MIKKRIALKIFVAILLTTTLSIVVILGTQKAALDRHLKQASYTVASERMNMVIKNLSNQYQTHQSWDFLSQGNMRLFGLQGNSADLEDSSSPIRRTKSIRVSLLDAKRQLIAGMPISKTEKHDGIEKPVMVDGNEVGYLVMVLPKKLYNSNDVGLAQKQLKLLSWVAMLLLLVTSGVAWLLSRHIGRPIKTLAAGTKRLTDGHYDTQLDIAREDEIGLLADNFNTLAQTLEKAKTSRQQWVADISHELRTPITVLQLELETLEDGLRPLTQDAVRSLKSEVQRLGGLVEDLYQLTQADTGNLIVNKTPEHLQNVIANSIDAFQPKFNSKALQVSYDNQPLPSVMVDKHRAQQLLMNIFENSVRYTDSGGKVVVSTKLDNNSIVLSVEDSAPAVPDDALPKLFDRLYRVDDSRSRQTGASGLGLAICDSIVQAHDGTISASHSDLGGLRIDITLPVNKNKH